MSVIAIGPIPGGPELLLILLVLVLLFGAQRIPRLARAVGSSIGEFQKGRQELENDLEEMRDDAQREGNIAKERIEEESKIVEEEVESAKS